MNEPDDVTRWKLGGGDAPDGFAELAEADAQAGPSHAQLTRMIGGIAVQVATPALAQAFSGIAPAQGAVSSAATAAGGAGRARTGLYLKLIACACVLGALALGIVARQAGRGDGVPQPKPRAIAGAGAKPPASAEAQPTAQAPIADAGERSHAVAAATPPAPVRPATHRAPGPPQDSAAELQLLESAQRALRDDPAQALAIAERHRRLFAHGAFAQEREMLAIEALVQLGQNARAAARARAFARRYPDSSHLPHLRDLVHATP